MQKAEVVLKILRKKSEQSEEYVFGRLYRNLFNPEFYMLAYNRIHAKEGNMTPGADGKTIDGFNVVLVEKLIGKIRKENYYPKPVRRVYIPKKKGGVRSLGIPSFMDKLVQEVLRMLLEAIYEPIFSENSHGFRPNRSCHTALQQVKYHCAGATWAVEGDIKGFFDNIDHEIMLSLLSRKISDGRVIELIRRFLKAGYLERHQVRNSLTGTPQGGLISPILANIYLHELDKYAEELCRQYSTEQRRRKENPEYRAIMRAREAARGRGDYMQADKLLRQAWKMPCVDPMDTGYIRVEYIRYADDFLVMVNGSKALASTIKAELGEYLRSKLKLELSEEKTLITYLSSHKVRFLDYDIAKVQDKTAIRRDKNGRKFRALSGKLQLLVPDEVITEKLRHFMKGRKAIHCAERINMPILDILTMYNAEIQGLYNYYCMATDLGKKLGRYLYYHYTSLLKTVAHKEKKTVNQVLKKYGVGVPIKAHGGTGIRRIFGIKYETPTGTHTRTYFNGSLKRVKKPNSGKGAYGVYVNRNMSIHQVIDRYNAGKCELCGYHSDDPREFEVHHVRKLNDIRQKYARRGKKPPAWVLTMSGLNRKTLIVCKKCHRKIHSGKTTEKPSDDKNQD